MIYMENIDERIKEYTEVIKKNPDVKELYLERAKLYDVKGDYEKAVEDFKKSLPGYYTFKNIKEVCEKNYLMKEAENFYTKAINKDKKNVYRYMDRFYFYMRNKKLENAIAECKNILKLSPENETILAIKKILTEKFY